MERQFEAPGEIVHVPLADEAATLRLGADIATVLKPGDLVALEGDLGAGKTTFARGLVQWLAGTGGATADIDVPSPTFTIIVPHETVPPVLHVDLYRISDPSELDELGIAEALDDHIVLVEWPQRAAGELPEPVLTIRLEHDGEGRIAHVSGPLLDPVGEEGLPDRAGAMRTIAVRAFLDAAGRGDAVRRHLTGDASTRAYETVHTGQPLPPILMNAPEQPDGPPVRDGLPYSRIAHLAEDVRPFVAVAVELRRKGLAAPRILAADLDEGLLLVENFGSGTVLAAGLPARERYRDCARMLAENLSWKLDGPLDLSLPDGTTHLVRLYDRDAMQIEVDLLADWYVHDVHDRDLTAGERETFEGLWADLYSKLERMPQTLALRDFHSPNIVWRDWKEGVDRIGLIDFQDALVGPEAYDLASLAQDARTDVSPTLEAELVDLYCATRGGEPDFDAEAFRESYAIMAAQRASKILGIFVRLDLRDGRPHYRHHLPRMQAYMERALAHPSLVELKAFYAKVFDL